MFPPLQSVLFSFISNVQCIQLSCHLFLHLDIWSQTSQNKIICAYLLLDFLIRSQFCNIAPLEKSAHVFPPFLIWLWTIVLDPLVPAGPERIVRSGFRIAIVYDNDVPGLSHTSIRVVSFFGKHKAAAPCWELHSQLDIIGGVRSDLQLWFFCSLFHLFQNLYWIINLVQHDSSFSETLSLIISIVLLLLSSLNYYYFIFFCICFKGFVSSAHDFCFSKSPFVCSWKDTNCFNRSLFFSICVVKWHLMLGVIINVWLSFR